ncbi:alpha/beta hydrolase [uncultured Treponema sp.]|uniref:alpha/beta hydrolase n=1 Tax=uncultured Treponema sp. TaxID=162155 RepID=UPI0025831C24|nr:alpha/beta hydrolase [uncultured Treponema sp.]
MYDLARVTNNGYFDAADNPEARQAARAAMNKLRTECFAKGEYPAMGGLPEERPENPEFQAQYWDYYKTKRGYHPRSLNSNGGWAATASASLMNTKLFAYAGEIQNAVLIVHGEKAPSRYMGETAYSLLKGENKELMIIPGATHCDLYDGGNGNYIPWDKLQTFFETYLK